MLPHPRPLPRLQMAAPRARLAAPRRRPAAAGGRSLPPSCCGKTRALGEEGGLLLRLGLGREPGHRRVRRSCAGGEGAPQAPGEKAAGECLGKGQPDSSVTTHTPHSDSCPSSLTTRTPRRRRRGSRYTGVPAGSRGAAAQLPEGGAQHPGARAGGRLLPGHSAPALSAGKMPSSAGEP